MKINLILFILLINLSVNAQNIASFKISYVLENISEYKIFRQQLDNINSDYYQKLKVEEETLLMNKSEIEESRIILNDDAFNKKVSEFEYISMNFKSKVNRYNDFLNKNIKYNEDIVYKEMLEIIKVIASERKIDLILSDNHYFLSSNNIDISDLIINKLNQISFDLIIEKFNDNE